MNRLCLIVFGLSLLVAAPTPTQACGGHRNRCHGHHRAATVTVAYAPPVMTYATPQMAQVAPTAAMPAGVVAAPAPTEIQPTYDYAVATTGQPAYYYTYDSSGKLIIAQWMDWVFRGGRAAGEPAPPLPIIGALRNR